LEYPDEVLRFYYNGYIAKTPAISPDLSFGFSCFDDIKP
jgi:hypothetical protein